MMMNKDMEDQQDPQFQRPQLRPMEWPGMLMGSELLSDAATTADGVTHLAPEMLDIVPTHAGNTDIGVDTQDGNPTMKGFRKRWSERKSSSASQCSDASFSLVDYDEVQSAVTSERPQKGMKLDDEPSNLPVVLVEDFEDQPEDDCNFGKKLNTPQGLNRLEQRALGSTNLGLFKFPWEKGRLAGVFGNNPTVKVVKPELQPGGRNVVQLGLHFDHHAVAEAKVTFKPEPIHDTLFLSVIRKADDSTAIADRTKRRHAAIELWWKLLAVNRSASEVGRKVEVEADDSNVFETAVEILDATFGLKSPGTLMKRAHSIQQFANWHGSVLNTVWLPVDEQNVWKFVKQLQLCAAPPTRASSLLEALRFAWFILGVTGANTAEESLRVKGICAQMKAKKRAWRPASILTVKEVVILHKLLENKTAALGDRCIAGHLLHLLYGRSRWSDMVHIEGFFVDIDNKYMECQTRDHKGARNSELKAMLLPIVTPCEGVVPGNWVATYLEVRSQAGLTQPVGECGPMMPAPVNKAATTWTQRPMSSEEGADFLRLAVGAKKTCDRRVSSHSMKSTAISWCAKYGVSDSHRAILARHVSAISSATSVYSRDLLSPVLRSFDEVLSCIRGHTFEPDRTRSGMMTPQPMSVPMAAVHTSGMELTTLQEQPSGVHLPATPKVEVPLQDTSVVPEEVGEKIAEIPDDLESLMDGGNYVDPTMSETSESDSVQSTSSGEEDDGAESSEPFKDRPAIFPRAAVFLINSKSMVVHEARDDCVLKCGRKISSTYMRSATLYGIRCSRCFDVEA